MRGRGEGGDAHELIGSIMKVSQKSLVGLALGEMEEESSSSVFSEKKEVKYFLLCVLESQRKEKEFSA